MGQSVGMFLLWGFLLLLGKTTGMPTGASDAPVTTNSAGDTASPTESRRDGAVAQIREIEGLFRPGCYEGTRIADPSSPTRYLWCVHGRYELQNCAVGTFFCSPETGCCNTRRKPNSYLDSHQSVTQSQGLLDLHALQRQTLGGLLSINPFLSVINSIYPTGSIPGSVLGTNPFLPSVGIDPLGLLRVRSNDGSTSISVEDDEVNSEEVTSTTTSSSTTTTSPTVTPATSTNSNRAAIDSPTTVAVEEDATVPADVDPVEKAMLSAVIKVNPDADPPAAEDVTLKTVVEERRKEPDNAPEAASETVEEILPVEESESATSDSPASDLTESIDAHSISVAEMAEQIKSLMAEREENRAENGGAEEQVSSIVGNEDAVETAEEVDGSAGAGMPDGALVRVSPVTEADNVSDGEIRPRSIISSGMMEEMLRMISLRASSTEGALGAENEETEAVPGNLKDAEQTISILRSSGETSSRDTSTRANTGRFQIIINFDAQGRPISRK